MGSIIMDSSNGGFWPILFHYSEPKVSFKESFSGRLFRYPVFMPSYNRRRAALLTH